MTRLKTARHAFSLFAACTFALAACVLATISSSAVGSAAASMSEFKGDPYTLDTCPVAGEKLGSMGAPVIKEYDGREVRFCCKGCVGKFESDQAKYIAKIDEKLTEQQIKHYPLTTCVVMPEDGLEEGMNLVYRNRLVRFCCKGCMKDFKADPGQLIAKLDEAVVQQQKEKYPLDVCPVSGEKLGSMGEPVNYVIGTTLIRLCCNGCAAKLRADPLPVIAKVHEGWKKQHASDGDHDHAH